MIFKVYGSVACQSLPPALEPGPIRPELEVEICRNLKVVILSTLVVWTVLVEELIGIAKLVFSDNLNKFNKQSNKACFCCCCTTAERGKFHPREVPMFLVAAFCRDYDKAGWFGADFVLPHYFVHFLS